MAWTTPATASAGSTALTAAFWNEQVRDNLDNLRALANVQSAFKEDSFQVTTNVTTFTDVTGLSVSITPTAATSKVLIVAYVSMSAASTVCYLMARLMRGSTAIAVPVTSAGSFPATVGATIPSGTSNELQFTMPMIYMDSPNTTSATTYKVQTRNSGAINYNVNLRGDGQTRTTSSITVWEIPQ